MTSNTGSSDARIAKRAAMRRATLHLVLGVMALDAVAILVWYLAIAHAPERTKSIYVGVWTVSTAIVVALLLKRVRKVRYERTSP